MQELTPNNPIIPVQSNFVWMMSLTTLILTLLACLVLWGYQFVMRDQISTLTTDISSLEQTLTLARSDRAVIIADILTSATIRPSIPLKEIVRAFRVAATQAGVRLQWFSVKDDIISTTLIATRDATGTDPVQTIINMMRADQSTASLVLSPIKSLAGSAIERTTNIAFRIASPNLTTNAK